MNETAIKEALGLPVRYRLEQNGRGHLAILDEQGNLLRTSSGVPVAVALSPSDHHTRKNERTRVRQALRARGIFN